MKRIIAVILCVAALMTLFCSCKDNQVEEQPDSSTEEVETFDISSVSLSDLPTEMLDEELSTWSTINLIAELPEENVRLYGLSVNEDGTGVIFRKNDDLYYFDWVWFTTQAKMPEIASLDIDDDEKNEIAISMYVDYNTNVSVEELHIIKTDSGEPQDICFTPEAIKAEFESKFDLRYETDETEEKTESGESETESKAWLIDHTDDVGKRIIFEQKADEVAEGKKAKKYFTYDATRVIRENGEYDGITAYDRNINYTLSKGKVTIKLTVAAAFKDTSEIEFICTVSAPVTLEKGEFKLGSLKFSAV